MASKWKTLKKNKDSDTNLEFTTVDGKAIKGNCRLVIKYPNGDIRLKNVRIFYSTGSDDSDRIFAVSYYQANFHGCKQRIWLYDIHKQGAKFAWLKSFSEEELNKPQFSEVKRKLPNKKIIKV